MSADHSDADRDLLVLAAKAAGIEYRAAGYRVTGMGVTGMELLAVWDPITDDGDALRLVVRLAQLFGFYRVLRQWLICMATENGDPADPCDATRYAIVRTGASLAPKEPA
jgi:hypothetical protein